MSINDTNPEAARLLLIMDDLYQAIELMKRRAEPRWTTAYRQEFEALNAKFLQVGTEVVKALDLSNP